MLLFLYQTLGWRFSFTLLACRTRFRLLTINTQLARYISYIVNTVEPERKKSMLGRFRPETKMRGRWIGYAALACVVGSFVLYDLWGWIPGVILVASAITLGKLGLDSNGRGMSLIALILGVVLMGVLLTVLIAGKENIGILPK